MLRTDRGNTPAILHAFPEAQPVVLWVCGARGGFVGPGQGTYTRLAEELRQEQIASLRLSYRYPNVLHECIRDCTKIRAKAAIASAQGLPVGCSYSSVLTSSTACSRSWSDGSQ